ARRGVPTDPDHIVLTASTSEAYSFVFKLLCDPGDDVLVPRPSYPLFDFLATLESVGVSPYALVYDGAWLVDATAVAAAAGPRTRAVVLVNPNNPTGSYLKRAEVEDILALAATRELALVSDEVFADYAFERDPRRVAAVAGGSACLTFSFGGLSKSCGLPQLKLAWIVVSGPAGPRDEALARLELVSDTYLSASTPVQLALPGILRRLPELQAPIRRRLDANLATLRKALGPPSPTTLLPVEGGWSAVLRLPATRTAEEHACRLLEGPGVLVHPGYFFDFEGEAYLVISLLPPEAIFEEGVLRLVDEVARAIGM
ncbi:MAG TPA: pyridoxal phosphate-dependent aminotransferase, partial [Vicinamibacteria bacterium]